MMLDLSNGTCILNLSCNVGKQNYYVVNSEWITMGLSLMMHMKFSMAVIYLLLQNEAFSVISLELRIPMNHTSSWRIQMVQQDT
jgi:hypothetical protein